MKRPLAPRAALALAVLALAAFGGTTLAAEVAALPEFRPPLLAPPPALATNASAMQVAIDSETGLLRLPTAGERLELAALAREAAGVARRAAAASQTELADGTVVVAVDADLYSLSTVTVSADGQLHYACGDAGHAHSHAVPVTAPAVEER